MNPEDVKPTGAQPRGDVPVENIANAGSGNVGTSNVNTRTPFERAAESAREQATNAAEAFRRGEFMREATVDDGANADDRLIGMLVYIIPVLLPLIVLLSESSNKRPFQRYHAIQSLGLSIVVGLIGIAVSIGITIISIVPLIGPLVGLLAACLVTPLGFVMMVIAMLYYGYQAYQGKRFAIPGLTSFLKDQGWV